GPTLTVSATSVAPNAPVTVTLANGTGNSLDWIGLFQSGTSDFSYYSFTYVGPVTSKTVTVTPPFLGTFEFRLFSNNGFTKLATSPSFTVAVQNPVPTVTSLSPAGVAFGNPAFTLTVLGTGFVPGVSAVQWDGVSRTTTVVTSTVATTPITAAEVASQGTHTVTVFNPTPGGGTSSGVTFTVGPQPP